MFAGFTSKLVSSRRGSVAIILALTVPILVGMVALGTEVTFVIYKHRQMQVAADSAALSAATALASGHPSYTVEAIAVAGTLGFVNGVASATVVANTPPTAGSYAGVSTYVEVIVSQPQTLVMISYFTSTAFNVSARAVAKAPSGSSCVLQTDPAATTGVQIGNGANVTLNQCGLAVNATGSAALSVSGGATLNSPTVSVAGQASVSGGGAINPSSGLKVNQSPATDPYASTAMPTAPAGCLKTNFQTQPYQSTAWNLSPGTYCGGMSIGNGATVNLAAGTYFMKSGTFNVSGGTTVTGSGVTIILTNNGGSTSYATVSISNGGTVTLSAPTSGATSGILFFADRNAPTTGVDTFSGGSTENFTGALYLPTQQAYYSNGTTTSSHCTQLVAWTVVFQGGSTFNNSCSGTGVIGIGSSSSQLVE